MCNARNPKQNSECLHLSDIRAGKCINAALCYLQTQQKFKAVKKIQKTEAFLAMAPFIFFSPLAKPSYSGWCNSQLNEAALGMLDWIHKRETCLDVLFLLTLAMHQQNWVGPDDAIYLHLSITFNCSHKLRQGRTGTEEFCIQVPSVTSRKSPT